MIMFLVANKIIMKDNDIIMVKSDFDNMNYIVRDLPDAKQASIKLSKINKKIMSLINHLTTTNDENSKYQRLKERYNPNTLSETSETSDHVSYSVNKGEKIALCLRNKTSNTFEDDNIIMFVVIHELAHIITEEVGHTDKFWDNMRELLEEAEKLDLYIPVDYSEKNKEYCGMTVKTTPYDFKK
jgi:predicted metal-dependent hydrolase|tara:strand:+ start:144 stop:695 length:552 start_codon:yes stop_codon:yes gene_type:complete